MPEQVTIWEMGPRDGLQNEKVHISTENKIRLVDMLSTCGFRNIETASFVSPKWVPQMSDGAEVMAGISRKPGVAYTAIAPNLKGYERARASKADAVGIFGSASDGFSRANVNCGMDEALERARPIIDRAKTDGMALRGYVSCAVACPYDGPVDPATTARIAEWLYTAGCAEISLGDTIGAGTPETIDAMLEAVLDIVPAEKLAGHYHDTNGQALENIAVSLDRGLRVFDSSIAGLGGCPYAPGAKGNVATEGVVDLCEARGLATGIDLTRLAKVATFAQSLRSG